MGGHRQVLLPRVAGLHCKQWTGGSRRGHSGSRCARSTVEILVKEGAVSAAFVALRTSAAGEPENSRRWLRERRQAPGIRETGL